MEAHGHPQAHRTQVAMVIYEPVPQTARGGRQHGVVHRGPFMRLRGVVEGLKGNGGKGDVPPGPDLAVERRVVARFAELPPDERGQVGAAALVVVVRRGATIMRGRGAGRFLLAVPQERLRKPHPGGAVGDGVMNAPDQSGAIAVDPDDVDPPQRPVAGQALLEERRRPRRAGRPRRSRSPGTEATWRRTSNARIRYPDALGSLTAKDDLQHLCRLDPRADQLVQLLDRGRGRAQEDHLAGVTGDRGALEVKDRPVLGTERDHVSRMYA